MCIEACTLHPLYGRSAEDVNPVRQENYLLNAYLDREAESRSQNCYLGPGQILLDRVARHVHDELPAERHRDLAEHARAVDQVIKLGLGEVTNKPPNSEV